MVKLSKEKFGLKMRFEVILYSKQLLKGLSNTSSIFLFIEFPLFF